MVHTAEQFNLRKGRVLLTLDTHLILSHLLIDPTQIMTQLK